MPINKVRLRKLHRILAPIAILPLLLTATTGILYQIAVVSGNRTPFTGLLDLHQGIFGPVNLAPVYPLLNGLGLITLAVSGIIMWFQTRPKGQNRG
ncbi:PepSY domain-containing protein [Laspinema olomoucense]|uniref:PepSY domain-containing protein n=1 Tax=Laspinema olomoucense D3b TaxID=2953688 RepID=A0ABT2N4A9_9CYAN|nr:PepSY domain-containing protein [Laspinema sp. D3b]MCT7977513.1 PepSY domain-containing protein [Laspinema sp. D3b]